MKCVPLTVAALAILPTLVPACGGSGDSAPSKLGAIEEKIFRPTCATSSCHGRMNPPKMQPLDLSAGKARAALVGVASWWQPTKMLVSPGKPDESFLIEKLTSTTPSPQTMKDGYTNHQMPSDCPDVIPCLSSKDIEGIRTWIANGALAD